MSGPDVSVVVLAWGDEPWLGACVDSALASTGVSVEVVVVDNGCTDGAVERVAGRPGVSVLSPGRNLGFAGGCNHGVAAASGDVVVLLNGDAEVRPDTVVQLAAALTDGVGLVTSSLRLASDPETMNSAGNPLHVLGLSWAGGLGEPAARHHRAVDVASVSGACVAVRREVWDRLAGFPEEFFAYHEDSELSLRCWQSGLSVRYEPRAVALHHYEFSRNSAKNFLLERNRLLLVLTLYERRTLLLLAGPLLLLEVAMLAVAVRQGWAGHKVRGWLWVLRHLGWVRERRTWVQGRRVRRDGDLAHLLTSRFDPAALPLPPGAGALDVAMRTWWRLVVPRLPRS